MGASASAEDGEKKLVDGVSQQSGLSLRCWLRRELCRVLIRSCCAVQKAGGEAEKAESGGWVRAAPAPGARRRGAALTLCGRRGFAAPSGASAARWCAAPRRWRRLPPSPGRPRP